MGLATEHRGIYDFLNTLDFYNESKGGSLVKANSSQWEEVLVPGVTKVHYTIEARKDHQKDDYHWFLIGSKWDIEKQREAVKQAASQAKLERIKQDGNRLYIHVPFAKKDEFKSAHNNARWDSQRKSWYLDNPTQSQIDNNRSSYGF